MITVSFVLCSLFFAPVPFPVSLEDSLSAVLRFSRLFSSLSAEFSLLLLSVPPGPSCFLWRFAFSRGYRRKPSELYFSFFLRGREKVCLSGRNMTRFTRLRLSQFVPNGLNQF